MDYNTIYVGMDVHKESFTVCCFSIESEKVSHVVKIDPDYKKVLLYIEKMRTVFGRDTRFICGYEAGCLGYSLYHELTSRGAECIILAPSTMLEQRNGKRIKTDRRDAMLIARCLAYHQYSPVHVPTAEDDQVKEFIRMRSDHKIALKKIKQQILAFCLRHNLRYENSGSNWTQKHISWLYSLELEDLNRELLDEYLATYDYLDNKIKRLERRIEELACGERYQESVRKLTCFLGIQTHTALALISEVSDFSRFPDAQSFASYLGLVPGERSSSSNINRLGITKAGNSHLRRMLIESAQGFTRGRTGQKSKVIIARQKGNKANVIAYADKANERLRRRYYHLALGSNKNSNLAKVAVARELACYIWGMMTDHIA